MEPTDDLKKWRRRAHAVFDRLWKNSDSPMTRDDAYRWLRDKMTVRADKGHIKGFNAKQCRRLIALLKLHWGFDAGTHDPPE